VRRHSRVRCDSALDAPHQETGEQRRCDYDIAVDAASCGVLIATRGILNIGMFLKINGEVLIDTPIRPP